MAAVQQAKNRRTRAWEKLARDVRNLEALLRNPEGIQRAPSVQIVRRKLDLVKQARAAFDELEDQYILQLQPDGANRADKLVYMNTVSNLTDTAIDATEEYLDTMDPAVVRAPSVYEMRAEQEQERLETMG